jgi:hypothetical protein
MPSKALEMAYGSIGAPFWGTWGHAPFLGPLREGEILFFYWENFYREIRETCKRRLWKRAAVFIGAPDGEPGGGSLTRSFERQMEGSGNGASIVKLFWAPFLWMQITLGA